LEQKKEEHGQAIAESIFEMAKLKVPTISIVIGEGSSGGALAIGVTNKIFMLENAIYSILSPEGYSSILWKDSTKYKEAAEKMKLTAKDLYELKIIDKIISEPEIMSEEHFNIISNSLKEAIIQEILKLKKLSEKEIVENRYQKFRKISGFMEV
jgi:acetyl-CoA carboxylase carboxyl transferase alpha subunit